MLNIDKFFTAALLTDEISALVGNRIYNPGLTFEEEDETPLPYLVVSYDSGSSGDAYKDSTLVTLSSANVSIMCVADSRSSLATLTEAVHNAVVDAFDNEDDIYDEHDDWNFRIDSCSESAGGVMLDPMKPCVYQSLSYACDTSNI